MPKLVAQARGHPIKMTAAAPTKAGDQAFPFTRFQICLHRISAGQVNKREHRK